MRLKLPFSKYSGSGNDFIFIDNRVLFLPKNVKGLVTSLCHRKTGIGADGVITVENSTSADFKMRIFNADGSEAEMCGNGARCLFKFLQEMDKKKEAYYIETMHSHVTLRSEQDSICVSMP
jgi:diaminopimelate epimerase